MREYNDIFHRLSELRKPSNENHPAFQYFQKMFFDNFFDSHGPKELISRGVSKKKNSLTPQVYTEKFEPDEIAAWYADIGGDEAEDNYYSDFSVPRKDDDKQSKVADDADKDNNAKVDDTPSKPHQLEEI